MMMRMIKLNLTKQTFHNLVDDEIPKEEGKKKKILGTNNWHRLSKRITQEEIRIENCQFWQEVRRRSAI